MRLFIGAGGQRILYKEATNESWLLEFWTAKDRGSELVVVISVMPFIR